jgi:hypothetical protein
LCLAVVKPRRRADGLLEAVSATTAAQLRDRTRSAA